MPVSGLVLVCGRGAEDALRELRADSSWTIGDSNDMDDMEVDGRVPVVLDTETDDEHRAQLEWVRGLRGISMVELAYADYRRSPQRSG